MAGHARSRSHPEPPPQLQGVFGIPYGRLQDTASLERLRSVADVRGRALLFSLTGNEAAYLVVEESPELRKARASCQLLNLDRKVTKDESLERIRVEPCDGA